MNRAELSIETLVLEGLAPAEAEAVGAALEQGLAQLVREHGLPGRLAEATVPAHVDLRPGEPPAMLGERLADAIYGRLAP
jgi:hypothetical protein